MIEVNCSDNYPTNDAEVWTDWLNSTLFQKSLDKNKFLNEIEYSLDNFHRSNQDTCLVHKPSVFEGQWVQSGDLLADCSASVGGELALGQNILIAYMPWEGYNFEDAILVSERLVYDDLYTSVHIERYEVELRETKQGNEEITREIPDVPESFLNHLNSFGIAKLGTWVEEGDILVGKVTPVNKKNQSNYQKLLYTILDKTVLPIRDSSLRAPKGIKAKVIGVQIFKHPKTNLVTNYNNLSDKKKLSSKKNSPVSYGSSKFVSDNLGSSSTEQSGPTMPVHPKIRSSTELALNRSSILKVNSPSVINENLFSLTAPAWSVYKSGSILPIQDLKKTIKITNKLQIKKKSHLNFSSSNEILNKNFKTLEKTNKNEIFLKNIKMVKISNINKNENRSDFKSSLLNSTKVNKGLKQSFIDLSLEQLNSYKNIFVTNNNFNFFSTHMQTGHNKVNFSNHIKNSLKKKFAVYEGKNKNYTKKFYFLMNQELVTRSNLSELSQKNKLLKKNSSITQTNKENVGGHSIYQQPIFNSFLKEAGSIYVSELSNNFILSSQNISSIQIYLAEKRRVQVGDKMAGRHGNKGIISQILPIEDMPFLPDGRSLDMVLNPLGVPSRMNVGQIYECLLGLAGKYLGENYKIFPFDEIYGAEASRSFVFSKLYSASLKTGKKWLFNPNSPGKIRLYDGRTGDTFDQSITVGYAYMLRLVHMVDDKIHARSTGPYSLVTQQPLRGRSKQGGQRLGEMEVWALEGYGAAFTLLEMLTIKSDDMTGRMTLWSNLILNKEISIGTPESFKVLICELQALCLDIGLFKVE
jgi:DNA-directed RNA polymerase subunit beta